MLRQNFLSNAIILTFFCSGAHKSCLAPSTHSARYKGQEAQSLTLINMGQVKH